MSSFSPSLASQALSTPSMTPFFCASDNTARGSTLPDASFVRRGVEHRRDPFVADARVRRAHRRRAGDDAVEEGRMTLRHQHRFAATGRTAGEVRAIGRLGIVLRDDLFGQHRDPSDGLIREVEGRLLLLHEAGVESVSGPGDPCRSRPRQSREAAPASCRTRRRQAATARFRSDHRHPGTGSARSSHRASASAKPIPYGFPSAPVRRSRTPSRRQ